MGYKENKYQKDLHQQAYDRLQSMAAYGQSKKDAVASGTAKDKIYSYTTYKTYWQQIKAFIKYVHHGYPECKRLKQARRYVGEWLQKNVDEGKSAWTVHTQAKALGKLFSITPKDKDYFKAPARHRKDIVRSRLDRASDKNFSKTNNAELIKFCRSVGARREGITKMKGRDLRTRHQILQQVNRLNNIAKERMLSKEEAYMLKMNREALLFKECEYFIYLREKGGRERISPIVGPDTEAVVSRIKETPPDEKVWQHVHTKADIHSYRADYANRIYRMYARPIEDIPYDRVHSGTGRRYQSDVYHCRGDEKGRAIDRRAAKMASIALGHNRVSVIASNYLRGL